jgi:hypothetical protein
MCVLGEEGYWHEELAAPSSYVVDVGCVNLYTGWART